MTLLVGHVTRKIVSEMTYNVSSGTLNSTIPFITSRPFGDREVRLRLFGRVERDWIKRCTVMDTD